MSVPEARTVVMEAAKKKQFLNRASFVRDRSSKAVVDGTLPERSVAQLASDHGRR